MPNPTLGRMIALVVFICCLVILLVGVITGAPIIASLTVVLIGALALAFLLG